MSDEPQPELRWAPIEPKPSRAKRVWLIAGIVLAALIVAVIVFIALLPHGEKPDAEGTPSPRPTSSNTPSTSPSPTASPSVQPTAAPTTPVDTPPPVADPSIEAFRGQVGGWLGDAGYGLDLVAASSGQDALSVVGTLQEDAQRLSDSLPPASILEQWYNGVDNYAQRLEDLRSAISAGAGTSDALSATRAELSNLKALVGL